MVLGLYKKKKKEGVFVSIATAQHNANIERVVYSSARVRKSLFWCGLVLPDFKISWGVLLVYLFVKYPISIRVRIRNAMREFSIYVRLKGGMMI